MKYRVNRFEIDMNKDQSRLEQFLNNLEGKLYLLFLVLTLNLLLAEWVLKSIFF
jgi:hypothetical protein